MAQKRKLHQFDKSFEKEIFKALKFYGFKLPKSDKEIENYVRMFGNTKIELPDAIADAGAIFDSFISVENSSENCDEILAMAAQGDKRGLLPEHILDKIKKDIKKGKWLNNELHENKQRRN